MEGLKNAYLIEPLDYAPFVWVMNRSDLILADSGGIQEEGPFLGKPALIMRDVTERPDAVEAGTVLLVGTNKGKIVNGVERVLLDKNFYFRMFKSRILMGMDKQCLELKISLRHNKIIMAISMGCFLGCTRYGVNNSLGDNIPCYRYS